MRRRLISLFGFFLMVAAGPALADSHSADSLVHRFDLKAKAVLSRAHAPTPHPIVFVGPGKAKADRHGVTVEFEVLNARGQRGTATFRWANLPYRPEKPRFAGRGRAKIRLPNAEFGFAVVARGAIRRAHNGDLMIHCRFKSVRSSDDGAKLTGCFVGIEP